LEDLLRKITDRDFLLARGGDAFGVGLFDKLRRRKRNVDGGVLAGLAWRNFGFVIVRPDERLRRHYVFYKETPSLFCAVKRGQQIIRSSDLVDLEWWDPRQTL
jgi:hypothetical protein